MKCEIDQKRRTKLIKKREKDEPEKQDRGREAMSWLENAKRKNDLFGRTWKRIYYWKSRLDHWNCLRLSRIYHSTVLSFLERQAFEKSTFNDQLILY